MNRLNRFSCLNIEIHLDSRIAAHRKYRLKRKKRRMGSLYCLIRKFFDRKHTLGEMLIMPENNLPIP